jgi:hypothetical protein
MPIAFLYEGQRLATAIFSYLGTINFGYIADRSAFPDLPRLGECMEESFAELLEIARSSQAEAIPEPPRRVAARRKPVAKRAAKRTAAAKARRARRVSEAV